MKPANKILTVAYGTFSCTLEGFDDPFSAMTDIAEYFRDLAAEDRYFGAEPPQPDPAMLRQIAESRANRQIEAEPRQDGVTLRPTEEPTPAAEIVEAQADAAFEGDSDPLDDMVEGAFDAQDAAQEAGFVAPTAAPDVTDSVAEKLARIRGVVAADSANDNGFDEDQHAEEWSGFDNQDTPEAPEAIEDQVDAPAAEADAPLATIETTAETSAEEALVAGEEPTEAEGPTFDEAAEVTPDHEADEQAHAPAQEPLEPTAAEEPESVDDSSFDLEAFEANLEADTPVVSEEPVSAPVAELEEGIAGDADTDLASGVSDTDAEPASVEASEDDDIAEPVRRVRRLRIRRRAQAELAAAAEAAEQIPAGTASAMEEAAEIAESDLADEDEADLMAELAAIAADDAAPDSAAIDDTLDLDEVTADAGEELSSDDLDALLAAAATEPESDVEDEDEISLEEESDGDGPDLERLFAATDSRLEGAETSRVHANISHLKAAVAARRADSTMDAPKTDGTDAYRVDLANTVRPRRAETAEDAPRTERPVQRPAPLVLVSEQRVQDEAGELPADPVRPRRVTTRELLEAEAAEAAANAQAAGLTPPAPQDEIPTEPSTDFEAFAIETGASDLTDVLEAAAAYATQVMGDATFSRPRLLHLASEATEDFSREEGLRAFGQLLRDGMIQKVSRGTFTLAESSRFLAAAARRAG